MQKSLLILGAALLAGSLFAPDHHHRRSPHRHATPHAQHHGAPTHVKPHHVAPPAAQHHAAPMHKTPQHSSTPPAVNHGAPKAAPVQPAMQPAAPTATAIR